MTQTLEKWDSLTFEWYGDVMVFCVFIFNFILFFYLEGTLGEDT